MVNEKPDEKAAQAPGDEPVNLFWTGGWDSSFQLLRLLAVDQVRVRPFYLIDEDRRSTFAEIQTMKRIRHSLFNRLPETRKLLEPMQYFGVSEIAPDAEISEAFTTLRKEKFIGGQYDWLARFCKQHSIEEMQLCVHRYEGFLAPESGSGPRRVDSSFKSTDSYKVFGYFSFPILNLSKVELGQMAEQHGFAGEMEMTWFCHRPTRTMGPCGRCNPCKQTALEGLARRLPPVARTLSFVSNQTAPAVGKLRAWVSEYR